MIVFISQVFIQTELTASFLDKDLFYLLKKKDRFSYSPLKIKRMNFIHLFSVLMSGILGLSHHQGFNPSSSNLLFQIEDLDQEAFRSSHVEDTLYYDRIYYDELFGETLIADSNLIATASVEMTVTFGLIQYLFEDSAPQYLDFEKTSNPFPLTYENGKIKLPHFYEEAEANNLFHLLAMQNEEDLAAWLSKDQFEKIKEQSIQIQDDYFYDLLVNRRQFENCCPNYIDTAIRFMKQDHSKINTLFDLNLEIYSKEIQIEISGQLKNGKPFKQVIIERDGNYVFES